jgi:hypothetical protein
MATVAEMMEFLSKFPPDAIVECRKEVTRGYQTYTVVEPVDIKSCSVCDYTSSHKRRGISKRGWKNYY